MCAIANVLARAPAMEEAVVISSESSTESDGELPASTGLIFTRTKRPPSQIWTAAGYISVAHIFQPLTVEVVMPSCESNSHST